MAFALPRFTVSRFPQILRVTTLALAAIFAISAVMVLGSGTAFGQTSKGIIAGTVTDNSGGVLANATVTVVSLDTGENRTTTTTSAGSFRIEAVNPGTYKVTVTQKGFATLSIDKLEVKASVITPVDARLQVGGVETTVVVEAKGNDVQTENGELSHSIPSKDIQEIPFQNRNPISLALTEPGVVAVGSGKGLTNGTGFVVNGLRPRANNFLIDGQDNNDNSIQGQALQPNNPEAIAEVTVLTNSYSAEFGRGGASVTNLVYKSGNNAFHGSAWELYSGSGLNSITPSQSNGGITDTNRKKPRSDTHIYGFTFGGPIVKNKLFFFGSPQWSRFYGNAAAANIAAPTANGVAALQAIGTPNAALLLQYFGSLRGITSLVSVPMVNGGRPAVEFGRVTRTGVAQNNPNTQWNFKVDYLPTSNDNLSVRYLHNRNSLLPDFFNFPGSLPGFDTQQGGPGENFGITETHTFSPTMVNEFRASYGYFDFAFAPTAATLANPLFNNPTMTIAGISGFPTLGVSSALPQGRGHATYQLQETLTWTRGAHVWKFGADASRLRIKDAIPFNFRGTVAFGSTNAGSTGETALENFLDNDTGSGNAQKAFGNPVVRPDVYQQAYYAQDTWKLRSNLTLNLGARYEYQQQPENTVPFPAVDPNNFAVFPQPALQVQEDRNNWSPRVGLAYTPGIWKGLFGENKTVIRAGYGMFYDSFFTNILDNTAAASPNAVVPLATSSVGRGLTGAVQIPSTLSPVLNPTSTVQSVVPNLVNPITHQWNLNVQRELPLNLLMEVAYVGTRGIRLLANDRLNYGVPGNGGTTGRLVNTRGDVTVRDNRADSIYHGMNVKVERRFGQGLSLRSAYTWGKSIDSASEVFTITGGTSFPQVPGFSNRRLERGLSAFDVRQRWVTSYVYALPGIKSPSNGWMRATSWITNGWQWSGALTLQSGNPDTFFVNGIDTDGDLSNTNNRPFMGNPSAPIKGFGAIGIDGKFLGKGAFNGAGNITPTAGTLYDLFVFNNLTTVIGGTTWHVLQPVSAGAVHFIIKPGIGDVGRNTFMSPGQWNWDMAVGRSFPIAGTDGRHAIQFRGELYNAFNHTNFNGLYDTGVNDAGFLNPLTARNGGRVAKIYIKYSF